MKKRMTGPECRHRRCARSRGIVYTEYLVVTATVFLVMSVAFYALGPRFAAHYQLAVQRVIQQAP
jgi:hypothetical protein